MRRETITLMKNFHCPPRGCLPMELKLLIDGFIDIAVPRAGILWNGFRWWWWWSGEMALRKVYKRPWPQSSEKPINKGQGGGRGELSCLTLDSPGKQKKSESRTREREREREGGREGRRRAELVLCNMELPRRE
jgi:hypothetical protein